MTALLLAALLQAAAAAPAPAAPTPATAPPAVSTAVSTTSGEIGSPTPEGLEALRQAFHDSCDVRLYGEYDDMCSAMADQIRQYRAALAKAARARPR